MLKDKVKLEEYLIGKCENFSYDGEICKSIATFAYEKYDIPKGIVLDFITQRMSMSEASEFVLFILLDSMYEIIGKNYSIKQTNYFYTEKEIGFYNKTKYENTSIKFPLVFKMIEIEPDQWIGKINIKNMMQLRKAQLINYNTNAQRTMQMIVRGGKESYKITLNKKAVSEIADAYQKEIYIPDTITLNIPLEGTDDFHYDEETNSLIIKSLDHFDIIDGYHRYIAACQESDYNSDFDYSMELRITNYSEDKAKQFIYQQDQKTKMKKVNSNSMNMNKAANIVVTRLNENTLSNLKGNISRNEGLISFGELAELVHYFYFKDITKDKERITIIQSVKELTENFNLLTEYNTFYLENKMPYKVLLTAMVCFNYYKQNNLDKTNMCETIEDTSRLVLASDNKIFSNKVLKKKVIIEIENLMKGVM